MMMTRMSDDRDDHISRSKTNDPTRDTSHAGKHAHTTTTNDSPLVITLFYLTFYILYIL